MRFNLLPLAAMLVIAPLASADEVEIRNCAGQSSAMYPISADQSATVNVAIKNFIEGASVSPSAELISDSGKVLSSEIKLGTAVFEGVTSGSWRFCPAEPALEIERVAVLPAALIEQNNTQTVAIGAGILGVGSLVAVGSRGGSSSKTGATTSAIAGSDVSFAAGTGSTTSGTGGNSGINVQNQSAAPCFIGDDVSVMSPFS